MDNKYLLIALGVLVLAVFAVIALIVKNTKKSAIKKQIEDLTIRLNTIRTIPLAFKMNKAQAMSKRGQEEDSKLDSYQARYKEVLKHIDEVTIQLEDSQDDFANGDSKKAKEALIKINETITSLEKEVKGIDEFLDTYQKKESQQRDISAKLKEVYRELKMQVVDNSFKLSIGYEGMEKKLEKCEELFSESEEWMYANDYSKAEEILKNINEAMRDIKNCYDVLPDLIQDAKGVIPNLYDEANRQFALSRQRGIYTEHISIETRLQDNQNILNESLKKIMTCDLDPNLKETLEKVKNDLRSILNDLEKENNDFSDNRELSTSIISNLENVKNLYSYILNNYNKDSDRYNIEGIEVVLQETKASIDQLSADSISLAQDVSSNLKPASEIKLDLDSLFNEIETLRTKLLDYKQLIDKNSNDEDRARTQLIKLQVVLNEVEVKVQEYHLPSIASTYKDDLQVGRDKINNLKALLLENPLNIELLNKELDEAIDYIYTFYNNVNNIVGMAIMVENAIIFGNKYRSTHVKVDRDLSKAEFAYLNGEYTKALTTAISCMETLFPNKVNEKILENS